MQGGRNDGVFHHAKFGITFLPPDGFHLRPRDDIASQYLLVPQYHLVGFRDRIEEPSGAIDVFHFDKDVFGPTVWLTGDMPQDNAWLVTDQERISRPGGGYYRESVKRQGGGLFLRKIDFLLPTRTGFVHFQAICDGARPEFREAILESAGTLSVG